MFKFLVNGLKTAIGQTEDGQTGNVEQHRLDRGRSDRERRVSHQHRHRVLHEFLQCL
jgi:hypothetical protein